MSISPEDGNLLRRILLLEEGLAQQERVDRLISSSVGAGGIRSSDYVAGSDGWQVGGDGSAEFNDVTVRGDLLTSGVSGSVTYHLNIVDGYIQTQADTGSGAAATGYLVPGSTGSIALYSAAYDIATKTVNDASYVQVSDGAVVLRAEDEDGSGEFGEIRMTTFTSRWDSTEPITLDTDSSINLNPDLYLNVTVGSGVRFYTGGFLEFELDGTSLTVPNVHNNSVSSDPVHVNASGVVGNSVSSRRFKRDIDHDAGADATTIGLSGATFRPLLGDMRDPESMTEGPETLGLIAEDVAEQIPLAATRDDGGQVRNFQDRAVLAAVVNDIGRLHDRLTALESR